MTNPYRPWLEQALATPDPWRAESAPERHRVALDVLPAATGRTLEVGCADGQFTALLAPRATQLDAVELVEEAARRARSRTAGFVHVHIRTGDILRRLPLTQYDTVVCMGVLYYVPQALAAVVRGRLVRRVRPGGLLLLQHERDAIVRGWDPEQGGAESLHRPFLGLGFEVVTVVDTGDCETLLLRRTRGSTRRDRHDDVRDLLREPWPVRLPDSGCRDAEADLLTGEMSGCEDDDDARRRVILRVHGRAAAVGWLGPGPVARQHAITVASHAADDELLTHVARQPTLVAPVPRHPLSSTPRPLRAGEVTVAVCTNRGPDHAGPLLEQLAATFDVVVIENGHPSPRLAELCAAAGVRHHHDARPGLAAARNRALALTHARWVLFLDDDCRLGRGGAPELTRRLGGALDRMADAGAVTGLVLPERLDTDTELAFEAAASLARGWLPKRHDRASDADPRWPLLHADWMGVGACLAVRRDAWDAVGGFDERLGAGTPARSAEDDVFLASVVDAGWAVYYEPAVSVRHRHRATRRELLTQLYGYGLGRSVHVLLRGIDQRDPRLVRLWAHLLIETWQDGRTRPARLALAELAGYLAGPAVALRVARRE